MKSKRLLFLFLAFSAHSCFSTSIYNCFKDREWELMEYVFVKKVQNDCWSIPKLVKNFAVGIGSYLSLFFLNREIWGWQINDKDWYNISKISFPQEVTQETLGKYYATVGQDIGNNLVCHLRSIPPAIMLFFLYHYWYKNTASYNAAFEFIEDWPEHKEFTPKELQESFEMLYLKNVKGTLRDQEVYEIIGVVKELLEKRKKVFG
jgi:hypothetical protein